jgi:hypothetical protein
MKDQDSNKWVWPPADQWFTVWGMSVLAIVAFVTVQLLLFFS